MSDAERYTAPEEYAYGTPLNFTAELDGLWCHATLPEGSVLKTWPYLPSGANATFHNLLSACTDRAVNPVGEDLWLGTDPLLDDSDRYLWDGFSVRPLYPSFGDGIPDGWEVHFGLSPLNRSNALDDPDRDGWDTNRDGGISDDVSRTETALKVGEALSTLEEYLVYYDDGNTVYPGLKSTMLGDSDGFTTLPLVYDTPQDTMAVMHYDVRALDQHEQTLYAMTKYGVSVLGLDDDTQSHHSLPQGVVLHDGFLARSGGAPYAAVLGTSIGFAVAPLLADGSLGSISTWDWSLDGPLHAVAPLAGEDVSLHAIGLGDAGEGAIVEIDGSASIATTYELGTGLVAGLSEANASVSSIQHGMVGGTTFTLFVGTDRGLFVLETTSARDDQAGDWRFFYTPDSTPIPTDVDGVRSLPLGTTGNPAEVRTIVLDGPDDDNAQALWFGTPAGLHKLDLIDDIIEHSGMMAHPGVDGKLSKDTNSIHAIHPTGDELLIGSEWGLWALAGDYSAVYGVQEQTRLPGRITAIATSVDDGNASVHGAASPGQFANLQLMDPGANDSDADGMPDGWEVVHGLDPTDPWDALYDNDADGLDLDQSGDMNLERLWTNLDEFRYTKLTPEGYNSTDPREGDTDGDGVGDGAEYYGFFYEQSNLWCHYTVQMVYVCDPVKGQAANATYLAQANVDTGTDPTNEDTDGDGMPDGWEIQHRRWIGDAFTGGNNWSLDPLRPDDANWDADGDGLPNLCEYQWSVVRLMGINGDLLELYGESPEAAELWSVAGSKPHRLGR